MNKKILIYEESFSSESLSVFNLTPPVLSSSYPACSPKIASPLSPLINANFLKAL